MAKFSKTRTGSDVLRMVEVLPMRMLDVACAMAPSTTAWACEAKYSWWLSPRLKMSKPACSAAVAWVMNSWMRCRALTCSPLSGSGMWSPRVYMPICMPWPGSKP